MRTKYPTKEQTKKALKERIANDNQVAVAGMLLIHKYQTADEQAAHTTKYENDVGFSGADSEFLSAMADKYYETGALTENQLKYVRKMMVKYAGQILLHGGVQSVPLRVITNAERAKEKEAWAKEQARKRGESTKRKVELEGTTLKISFPYDPARVAAVKALSGRKWVNNGPLDKYWTAPISVEDVQALQKLEWDEFDQKALDWLAQKTAPVKEVKEIPGLKGTLYPFQHGGVSFIESRGGRALIGDEMGLGKTVQALAWLQLHPEARPAVIVVPASLKLNWEREVFSWMTDTLPIVLSGRPKSKGEYKPGNNKDVFIINYDILPNKREKQGKKQVEIANTGWADILLKLKPKAVILDECHYIKNSKAYRTKDAKRLCKAADHVICLSGTPIINRPIEMFNAIQAIEPGIFPSFWDYAQRYCGATHNGFGWDFGGAQNEDELHEKLVSTIMLRRLKKDVLKDLPPKVRTVIPLELSNRAEYDKASADFIEWLGEKDPDKVAAAERAETLVRIEKLKQLCIKGKGKQAVEWIRDYIEQDGKLVVFATHKATIKALQKHFPEISVVLDGSTAMKDRQAAVDRFQKDPKIKLFLGNIKAAGVGLTLTAASATCFVELGWTPGEHDQAEDRVHRIGQEADSVNAYYLVADGSVETEIAALLDEKRKVLAAVLDGEEVEEAGMLTALLERMTSS